MPPRPTREDLAAARGRTIADVIAPDLRVLFVGINPGLWSGATGYHFARPGNRFWPVLHRSVFTPRQLEPGKTEALLALGIGISNLVARTSATAAELSPEELRDGTRRLTALVARFRPGTVAVLGVGAYRAAFEEPRAGLGRQPRNLAGRQLWVLPNPSGLNAHYQLPELTRLFAELRRSLEPG